jgi:hypothetical protein
LDTGNKKPGVTYLTPNHSYKKQTKFFHGSFQDFVIKYITPTWTVLVKVLCRPSYKNRRA